LELCALIIMILALAQAPAEWYLASFGESGMRDSYDWNFLTAAAYNVRHLPTLTFLGILMLAAFLPAAFAVALLLAPSTGRKLARASLIAVIVVVTLVLAPEWPHRDIRRAALGRVTERMGPLIGAIEQFEAHAGRPPHTLAELTGRHQLGLAAFGIRGCRPLQYSVASDNTWRWQLSLECPNGMMALDYFFFRPSRDYSDWGHNIERVGDWAYRWD
jgi:hypothetical protein